MNKKSPLLLVLLVQPALAADPELLQCRQIADADARVECYDRFVDANHIETPAQAPDAQSLFGTPDAEAKRIVETTLAIEQIEHIEATITEARRSTSKKLTVALDNGQVWRQLDNKPMRLKDGDAVVIRKASLGSYLMEKASGSRPIRVKRVN